MLGWMLSAPPYTPDEASQAAFAAALALRDAGALPEGVPRWTFLEWLAREGYMLHGSSRSDLTTFEPRTPNDRSPDDFSKQTAVFAASDGIWALMYALSDRERVMGMLNMALQLREAGSWSGMRYYLSLAPRDPAVTEGRALLRSGSVYVLPRDGFEQMPSYPWPGLGTVLEPHWVNPGPVSSLLRVPVAPEDFPLPVGVHDAKIVNERAADDPWGFPWLEP